MNICLSVGHFKSEEGIASCKTANNLKSTHRPVCIVCICMRVGAQPRAYTEGTSGGLLLRAEFTTKRSFTTDIPLAGGKKGREKTGEKSGNRGNDS